MRWCLGRTTKKIQSYLDKHYGVCYAYTDMKVTSPLFSTLARGTLGKLITFSTKWGRPIARAFHAPTGPASNNQLAHRATFKSIITEWQDRTPAEKQGWQNISGQRPPLSGYNIFLSLPINRRNVRMFGNALFGTFYFGAPVPK